jgi:CyaY protein
VAGDEVAVAGFGNCSGPFWPQAASSATTAAHAHTLDAAFEAAATLILRCNILWILSTMSANLTLTPLSDAEYLTRANAVLASVEASVDAWLEADVVDIDAHRTGGLLEMSFPNRSVIVLNTQPPLHEIWLAARSGGFHYKFSNGAWRDTRDGRELFEALSACATEQAGKPLKFTPPA